VLLDMDGVLWIGSAPVDGAAGAVQRLRQLGCPLVFVTNTSMRPRCSIIAHAHALGFELAANEVLTPLQTARRYLQRRKGQVLFLISPTVEQELDDVPRTEDEQRATVVLLGDRPDGLNREDLNRALRAVMAGAELVAFHRNRYWRTERGLEVDLGAYVAAVEYAAKTTAIVLGKPSPSFFEQALELLGRPADEAIMVGDDIEHDIGGAQQQNVAGVLVQTGKFDQNFLHRSGIMPSAVIKSIADLPHLIAQHWPWTRNAE